MKTRQSNPLWWGVTAVLVLVLSALAGQAGRWRADRLADRECRENLRKLGEAMELYSTDYAGRYPRSLRDLEQANPQVEEWAICPHERRPYTLQTFV